MTASVSGTDSASARGFESRARKAAASTLAPSRLAEMDVEYIQESAGLSAGMWLIWGMVHIAMCGEGVGTKNVLIEELVAALKNEPWPEVDPYTYYYNITRCGVAMIVNDLITVGALPMGIIQILALYGKDWHTNEVRMQAVIDGWRDGVLEARGHWSGGETAELNGSVIPPNMIVDGASWGIVPKGVQPALPSRIEVGDEVVLVASTGIHSNGLTGARAMCADLGYNVLLPGGRRLVDVLLTSTAIYVQGLADCYAAGLDIHHLVHITGGGLSRLIRQGPNVHYVLTKVAVPQPEFRVIQQYKGASLQEMYEAFNMGQGMALIVKAGHGQAVAEMYTSLGQVAWVAGRATASDHRRVTIVEHDLTWVKAA